MCTYMSMFRTLVAAAIVLTLTIAPTRAQSDITTPSGQLGFDIGDDYQLATYTQLTEYWRKLDKESSRMRLVEIGKTAEGRPHFMAVIT